MTTDGKNYTYEFYGLNEVSTHEHFLTFSTNTPLEHLQIDGVVKLPVRKELRTTETWTVSHLCVIPVFNEAREFTGQLTRVLVAPRDVLAF